MNSSQFAAWAVKNVDVAEQKMFDGKANENYVLNAEAIRDNAVADAHYNSKEGRQYRKMMGI